LGTFQGHKIFLSLPHSLPYFWLHFLPLLKLFHTDPAVASIFAVEVVPSHLVSLLKAGIPITAGILAVANNPAAACFPAVAGLS
jgi:hypothetical protein